MRRGRH